VRQERLPKTLSQSSECPGTAEAARAALVYPEACLGERHDWIEPSETSKGGSLALRGGWRITPEGDKRPLYPKEGTLQEGFSLAAGGGSAP
jgi:hypothetical protein